jgi:hypothetical protein
VASIAAYFNALQHVTEPTPSCANAASATDSVNPIAWPC